jgi:hypothetical protein
VTLSTNLIVNDAGYKTVAEKWGTGGSYSMTAAAVTGVSAAWAQVTWAQPGRRVVS